MKGTKRQTSKLRNISLNMDQFSPRYNARYPIDLCNFNRNAIPSSNQFWCACADRKYLTIFQEENPIGKFDDLVG